MKVSRTHHVTKQGVTRRNPRKKPRNFKSMEAYRKYLAYGHIHGDFARSPGNTPVRIRGRPHRVKHTR